MKPKKKHETDVPSFKNDARLPRDKSLLVSIAEKINLDIHGLIIGKNICSKIEDKMYDMEKYSTQIDNNKMTYLIIPANHPSKEYIFPLNLEDRTKMILNNIQQEIPTIINPTIKTHNFNGTYDDIKYHYYEIHFDKNIDKIATVLEKYAATKEKNGCYTIVVD